MEKAKYPPEEIDRMIDEEISRIEAANMAVAGGEASCEPSPLCRIFAPIRAVLKRCCRQNKP